MWVRSQDKTTIVNVEMVEIREWDNTIIGHSFSRVVELGSYSTEEKVLKVLIHLILHINAIEKSKITGTLPRDITNMVFQMPKDDEV